MGGPKVATKLPVPTRDEQMAKLRATIADPFRSPRDKRRAGRDLTKLEEFQKALDKVSAVMVK